LLLLLCAAAGNANKTMARHGSAALVIARTENALSFDIRFSPRCHREPHEWQGCNTRRDLMPRRQSCYSGELRGWEPQTCAEDQQEQKPLPATAPDPTPTPDLRGAGSHDLHRLRL
jgi:hypothetical protein